MDSFVIAQIFGLFGALSLLLSSWQKKRDGALTFVLLDSLFYSIQYFILGAFSGLITNVISLSRTLTFKYKNKIKIFQSKMVLYFFLMVYLISLYFTYDGIACIFPTMSCIMYTVFLFQDDVKKIRIGTLLLALGWFIYNLSVRAYASAIIEFILFCSTLISIIKIDFSKKIDKSICQ